MLNMSITYLFKGKLHAEFVNQKNQKRRVNTGKKQPAVKSANTQQYHRQKSETPTRLFRDEGGDVH